MIASLIAAELRHRPGRALFLVAGYAFGVAVMVVLLAVGEAMLDQARDQELVGGGDALILPAGVSPDLLKAGGTSSLYAGLDQARFIQRQILESPRGREDYGVIASSPVLDARMVRIRRGELEVQALATGEIPSRAAAVGAAPDLLAGAWNDSDDDRRWVAPTSEEFLNEIDAFHLPYESAIGDSTWAEWHYFNVTTSDGSWIYLTLALNGRIGVEGEWGGGILLTTHEADVGYSTYSREIGPATIRFDTLSAELTLDDEGYVRQRKGRYEVFAGVDGAEISLVIEPIPNHTFPPAELGGAELVSGYVVPALAARASGRVCIPLPNGTRRCHELDGAPAYHDHNWGVWRDVSWEWGAASDGETSLLYGVVKDGSGSEPPLFAYLVDSRGVRGIFRPDPLTFTGTRSVEVDGRAVTVPTGLHFEDRRRGLAVDVTVESVQVTDTERTSDRYFLQMRGVATVRELGGFETVLPGSFETYVD